MEFEVSENDNSSISAKEKDWAKIESDFFNRYKTDKCISFDYGLSHDYSPEDVEDLLTVVSNLGGSCPFKIFYFGTYTESVKCFVEKYAPSITELHLAHWCYRDGQFFPEGVPNKLDFSALKKLHIKLVVDDGEVYNIKKFFSFITEIFRGTLSSLQEVYCTFPGFWDGSAMEELLRSLVAGGNCTSSLKRLELSGCFLPTHFLILSALDYLHLKRLALKFCGVLAKHSTKCIKRFLQSQSASLESLEIEDVDSTSKCVIMFPRMEKLEKIKIFGSCFGGTGLTFHEVVYSKQFPVLEKLTLIRIGQGEWDDFVGGQLLPCSTLRELKIRDSEVENLSNASAKVRIVFPNLMEFKC